MKKKAWVRHLTRALVICACAAAVGIAFLIPKFVTQIADDRLSVKETEYTASEVALKNGMEAFFTRFSESSIAPDFSLISVSGGNALKTEEDALLQAEKEVRTLTELGLPFLTEGAGTVSSEASANILAGDGISEPFLIWIVNYLIESPAGAEETILSSLDLWMDDSTGKVLGWQYYDYGKNAAQLRESGFDPERINEAMGDYYGLNKDAVVYDIDDWDLYLVYLSLYSEDVSLFLPASLWNNTVGFNQHVLDSVFSRLLNNDTAASSPDMETYAGEESAYAEIVYGKDTGSY